MAGPVNVNGQQMTCTDSGLSGSPALQRLNIGCYFRLKIKNNHSPILTNIKTLYSVSFSSFAQLRLFVNSACWARMHKTNQLNSAILHSLRTLELFAIYPLGVAVTE